jgi:polyvinyl alcohol dehydrogenase (cytochrome)
MSLAIRKCSLCLGLILIVFAMVQAQPQAQPQAPPQPRPLGTEDGFDRFQRHCMTCHGYPTQAKGALTPSAIREMTPERILAAINDGKTHAQVKSLTEEEKIKTAEFLSNRPIGSAGPGDAKNMPNRCSSNPALADPAKGAAWNGWGVDAGNTRFQPSPGITAEQVPRLKLKWAFGYPKGVNASGQPTIASGRVFVGTDIGYVYSLDAASGCVYWSYETKVMVRNAISIGPVKGNGGARYAAYFGDAHANVYALDAQTGNLLWKAKADNHYSSRITAAPTVHDGAVYVPVSSSEEYAAVATHYECCTFRGSVVALNANTGKQIWKAWVIPEPKPTRKNSQGTQLYAPAGGAVWNSPTVDAKQGVVYFGTGDSETSPVEKTIDAVMAVDIKTGKTRWVYQAVENDSFLVGCGPASKSENCPQAQGPDSDIGNSPILRALPNGKRVLVTGTKEGGFWANDPDNNGVLLWRVPKGTNPRNGIFFGGSADEENVYYGYAGGGAAAFKLATGEPVWFNRISAPGTRISHYAATSAIPGAVFVSGSDGVLTALSTKDGAKLWEFESAKEFETVNKVPAKGGSLRAPGPTIAGGMLFMGSGYAVSPGDKAGNVLLAFSVQ